MKALFFFVLLVASATAYKTQLLNKNRTPKESFQSYVAKFGSACDECQLLVKRFEEAAKDPAKMATLKGILSLLCHETSYEEECKVVVSRLDLIIDRLLPYLKDPLTVCKKFHMCGNSRLEQFRKIAMLYAQKYVNQEDFENDLVCEECQFAANELRNLIDQKQTQDDIRHFLSNNICAHLGRYRGSCDIVVEQFLPEFFQELHHVLENQKEFCADLGLCKHALPASFPLKAADKKMAGARRLQNVFSGLRQLKSKTGSFAMSCFECKVAIDALLIDLKTPANTKKLANDIKEGVCPKLPAAFLLGCNDFIDLYMPTVVMMTLQQFTPEGICQMLHTCENEFVEVISLSKKQEEELRCEACNGITSYFKKELGDMEQREELEYGIQYALCSKMPVFVQTVCETFFSRYISVALNKIDQFLHEDNFCTTRMNVC
ncbi:hypothetical protein QR680_002377 [Steinernema hermaphroditum]|uniref:Saposin B-type domain-containing protein n=1 Tax=Steinernema hermaphroditum TaxID=289476 RepID=A0AA39H489_9BILA|nr:hypothetical protein QR680_002377 [Steinernema hermaphroditum]